MVNTLGAIPLSTVERLSIYLRTLRASLVGGMYFISSTEIGKRNDFTAAQVRKDLSCFGNFGIKGKGYNISELIKTLETILGLDREWKVAIFGLGKLGGALASYKGLKSARFNVVAIFDVDPKKVDKTFKNIPVYHSDMLKKVVREKKIQIAIVAVPTDSAKATIQRILDAGIKGILNFTEARVPYPNEYIIKNVNLAGELESISYYLIHSDR